MKLKTEAPLLIFDYDGTLHDSIQIYAPAFRRSYEALERRGCVPEKQFTDMELSRWLGFSAQEMWQLFMPELPQEFRRECSQMIGEEMVRLTEEDKALLYPGALNMLERLKADYRLILLSNCKRRYLEAHRRCFDLDKYFDDFHCAEEYHFIPKWKILRTIRNNAEKGKAVVIGDRLQDMDMAQKNGLPAIGCAYGYGNRAELAGAARIVNDCTALYTAIKEIMSLCT